jgi:superfamily II DNA or RNA helicase
MSVGYVTLKYEIKWTTSLASVEAYETATKDELISFLRENATQEDRKLLSFSTMTLLQVRRHVAALLGTSSCLSPYEEFSKEKLVFMALHQEVKASEIDACVTKRELIDFLCKRIIKPLHITEKTENVRQHHTSLCLNTLQRVLGPFRFVEEAKHFLGWAFADGAGHKDGGKLLMKRMSWVEKFGIEELAPKVKELQTHLLPFLQHCPKVIPWRSATFENLGIDETVCAIGVPESVESRENGFFVAERWREQPGQFELRSPQREALVAVSKEFSQERSAKTDLSKQYLLLSYLRSWFGSLLFMTYAGEEPTKEFLERGACYRGDLETLGDAAKSLVQPSLIVLPTGVGKTTVLCLAPFSCKARRVLVLAPNLTLKSALKREFRSFYQWTGIAGKPVVTSKLNGSIAAEVVVVNVQQMQGDKLLRAFPRDYFDLVLVDEAHHAEAKTYRLIREHFYKAFFLYLTATPFRGDGKILDARAIYSCTMHEAVESKYLKNVCYDPVPVESVQLVAKGGVKVQEFWVGNVSDQLYGAFRDSAECKRVVMSYAMKRLRYLRGISGVQHQAIAQASDLKEAKRLVALWRNHPENKDEEFKVDYVGSGRSGNAAVLKALISKKIDIIVHVGMLGEGFDHTLLSVCVVFRRFGSFAPFAQFVGRVIRRIKDASDEDNKAYIISHPALGLITHWTMYKRADVEPINDSLLERGRIDGKWIDIVDHKVGELSTNVEWFM